MSDDGKVVSLATKQAPVTYELRITHAFDGNMEVEFHGVSDDEGNRERLANSLRRAANCLHAEEKPFQQRVQPWLMETFGEMIAGDREERNHRYLEEALELVQSLGCTADEAHKLVDYVFGRPPGYPAQEVGGVMVTLAALCLANKLDMHQASEAELSRIWNMVEQIRAKQLTKPQFGPLPGVYPDRTPNDQVSKET